MRNVLVYRKFYIFTGVLLYIDDDIHTLRQLETQL
jgi:hypothetical protein